MTRLRGALRLLRCAAIAGVVLTAAACEEEPLFPPSPIAADTVDLFSAAREDQVGQPSVFDFINLAAYRVELPGTAGTWDLLLTEQNGQAVFVPSAAITAFEDGARMTVVTGQSFASLESAPRDRASYTDLPRPVATGTIYVMRTRGSSLCSKHVKFHVVESDPVSGRVRIAYVQNPNCGDRDFFDED